MYSGRSFRDAYLEIYQNLNEAASTNPYTNPKAAETAVKKATEAPKASPAPETTKASPAPEAPKSPFASKSELDNLRSSAARATVSGPSKEAQALMSPRTKRILSGNSVYSRGSGRDDMIAGNLQRARGGSSTQASTSTDKSSGPDMSKFQKVERPSSSGSSSSQAPSTSSSSSTTSPTVNKFSFKYRGGDKIGNNKNTNTTVINKTTKSPEDRLPKRPDGKSEKPDGSNDKGDTREKLKGLRKLRDRYNAQQLASSYEYENDTLIESHYKVGDKVTCKASGMTGEVVKVGKEEEGKYYTVKREDGKSMKYAPDELKKGGNGGAPKGKEEKFHTSLDKLVHKTFGSSPEEKKMKEETDLFDYVLEYLVSEGYADTNENALVIMANMSEEWRGSIVEELKQLGEGYKKYNNRRVFDKMNKLNSKGDLESIGRAGQIRDKLIKRSFSSQIPDREEKFNKNKSEKYKRSKMVSDNTKKTERKSFSNRLTRGDGQGIRDSYEYGF